MELSKTLKCLISVVHEHTYNITVDIKTAPEIFVHFKNFNLQFLKTAGLTWLA